MIREKLFENGLYVNLCVRKCGKKIKRKPISLFQDPSVINGFPFSKPVGEKIQNSKR